MKDFKKAGDTRMVSVSLVMMQRISRYAIFGYLQVLLLIATQLFLSVPASAEMSADELTNILVKHFSQSYFGESLQIDETESGYPVVKWQNEIAIDVVNSRLLPGGMNEYPRELVAALRASGFDIRLSSTDSDRTNVSIILFDAAKGFSQADLDILMHRMSGNAEGLEYFVGKFDHTSTCFMGGQFSQLYYLKEAFAAINVNMPNDVVKQCLGTMISGIVGFQGKVHNGVIPRSIFSSDQSLSEVSDWDGLAFQMLADRRLPAGARYTKVTLELLQEIAADLVSTWPDLSRLEKELKPH